jgi:hypothetical protein
MGLFSLGEDPKNQALMDGRSQEEALAGLLQMPTSPMARYAEEQGTGKVMGKQFLDAMTGGWFRDSLFPDYASDKAQYALDVKDYAAQQKMMNTANFAANYQDALSNDDTADDLAALQQAAVHQPEVYGPVLRDMMQTRINPTPETFTEGEYQKNPETGEWEWRMQGDQGTLRSEGMGPDFVPESRMPTPDYIDGSIGKADVRFQSASDGANQARGIIDQMDQIGEDGWSSGLQGEASEFYKAVSGTEDFVSTVRKNYQDVKVRSGIKNLPPGVASDKDIDLALSPWPESTSDFNFIKRKLEAIERIEKGKAAYARFESQYISDNGGRNGLQNAWSKTEEAQSVTTSNKPTRTWTFVDEE